MKLRKKKKKGFTLIELLAVIVVLAIIMIIAIPNILNTMTTSKKESLKVYAEKMFNEAQKNYEETKLTSTPSPGGATYNISSGGTKVLAPNQTKYRGCVVISSGANYTMTIYISDGEFALNGIASTAVKDTTPTAVSTKPATDKAVYSSCN